MMRAGFLVHIVLLQLRTQLMLGQLPQARADATCDWSLLGRMLEAVSDTCCFDAAEPNDPPLGNTARLRQQFHEQFVPALYDTIGEDGQFLVYCQEKGGQACAEYYTLATMRGPSTERYGVPANNQCRLTDIPSDCSALGPSGPFAGCEHLYPACAQCAASCETAAFQVCVETCDRIYNFVQLDASSLATTLNAVCASAVVDCQGTCLQGFADVILDHELRNAPSCGEGVSEPCNPPETIAWMATWGFGSGATGEATNPELGNEIDRCIDELDDLGVLQPPRAPPGCNCDLEPNPAAELLCTETSCDATCAMVLQPLMDTCRSVLDVLFDANDGTADGVAGTFTTLYATCPAPQSADTSRRSKLTQAACSEFALSGTVDGVVPASPLQVCDEDGYVCVDALDNMISIAAMLALTPMTSANPWLQMCEPNGIYESCSQIYDEIQNVVVPGSPNLNWKEAVLPSGASWSESLTARHGANDVLKCSPFGTAGTAFGSAACSTEDSTWPTADSDSVADGPMPATSADGAGWADVIADYSSKRPPEFRARLARCEEALASRTSDSSYCSWDVPAGDVGTFFADCGACSPQQNGDLEFSFTSGESSSTCLSYFVGYMEYLSSSFGGAPGTSGRDACLAQFRCPAAPNDACEDHAAFLVSTAESSNTAFCDYTPASSVAYYSRGQPPPTGIGGEIVVPAGCEANPCAAGESCSFDGSSTTCTPCPEYTYSNDGLACGLCQPGQAPNADKSGCVTCREGYYSEFGVVCRAYSVISSVVSTLVCYFSTLSPLNLSVARSRSMCLLSDGSRRGHTVRTKLPSMPIANPMPVSNDIWRRSPPASATGGRAVAAPFRCACSCSARYGCMRPLKQTTRALLIRDV